MHLQQLSAVKGPHVLDEVYVPSPPPSPHSRSISSQSLVSASSLASSSLFSTPRTTTPPATLKAETTSSAVQDAASKLLTSGSGECGPLSSEVTAFEVVVVVGVENALGIVPGISDAFAAIFSVVLRRYVQHGFPRM